jgi:tetratricopeptide (TPR) repeat protein
LIHIVRIFVSLLVAGLLLSGCSAERSNPMSKSYHNVTAHYNSYFLAKEKLREVEAKVWEAMPNDYNRVLPIFPPLDTTFLATLRPDLEDVIKKASIAIQRHKNSRWVDDSYLLIGKARYYQNEPEDAIRTFKYVNLTSKDPATKHEALVWLMRMFIETRSYEEAVQVSDYLDKLELNQDNYRDHYLTRAYYLTVTGGSSPRIIDNLSLALPYLKRRDERSRVHFILAQLHQNLSQDDKAYAHYRALLRKNPPYELGFHSKLSIGLVSQVANAGERARIERYFRKLLKDGKNLEYKDKIYYEMARFEVKQQLFDKALFYLRKSVQESSNNPTQQAYSYLLAGRIYFENLQKYRQAHIYYDSALQVYPQDAEDYMALAERRDILADFATQITTIETEDSLQILARLDTAALHQRIDEIIALQQQRELEAQKAQAAREAQALKARNRSTSGSGPGTLTASLDNNTGGAWYFDNPTTVATARTEFSRKWGDRPLQDNWRRVNQRLPNAEQIASAAVAAPVAEAPPDPQEVKRMQYEAFLQNIPLTPAQMEVSEKKVEDALYSLGLIYQHKLKEPKQAMETYEQLVTRFPQTAPKAEVLYSLYLLHLQAEDGAEGKYAAWLKKEFPESRFAYLIDNPNYEKISSADRLLIRQLYDSAYTHYEKEKYPEAIAMTRRITKQFPGNELEDKIGLLNTLLIGRTQPPAAFKAALIQFGQDFPASPLQDKAQELLLTYADFEQGKLAVAAEYFEQFAPPLLVQDEAEDASAAPELVATVASPGPDSPFRRSKTPNSSLKGLPELAEVREQPMNVPAVAEPIMAQPNNAEQPMAETPIAQPEAIASPEPAEVSPYQFNDQGPHLFVVAYPEGEPSFDKIKDQFSIHNDRYHKSKKLEVSQTLFKDNMALLVLQTFTNGKTAHAYANMQKTKSSPLSKVNGVEFVTFVISADNLPVFLERKNMEEYLKFFQKNYAN